MTLYIDVYFLINFTVDLLAVYFSCTFSKTRCSVKRMITASLIGALYSVFAVLFFNNKFLIFVISFFIFAFMILIITRGLKIYRKFKYAISFLLFQLFIGGCVYYGYCTLSNYISDKMLEGITENNKSILILSLLVLLSIGIIKLILLFFNNVRCEGSAVIELHLNERHIKFDALIDSGNLAKDPFDSSPVMLIGVNEARKLVDLPDSAEKYDNLLVELKKRIRIIPITRGGIKKILYGIKPDKAFYVKGKCKTEIKITMAIDYDEGVYGGYTGLIPLSALEEIV